MERNVILLCLIFITCATPYPSGKPPSDIVKKNQETVDACLARLGFPETPDNNVTWRLAIYLLENELERTRREMDTEHNRTRQEFERTRREMDTEHNRTRQELERSEKLCLAYETVLTVRSALVEETETVFRALGHKFPRQEKDMKRDLTTKTMEHPNLFTDSIKGLIEDLPSYTSKHTFEWLHYLAFSNHAFASAIRNEILNSNRLTVFTFCMMVGSIYTRVSNVAHTPRIANMDLKKVREGLLHFGMRDIELDTILILLKLPRMDASEGYYKYLNSIYPSTRNVKQRTGTSHQPKGFDKAGDSAGKSSTNQPSGNVETNDGRAPQPKGSDEAGKAGNSAGESDTNQPSGNVKPNDGSPPQLEGTEEAGKAGNSVGKSSTNQPSGNVETNDGRAPQPKGSDEAGKAGNSAGESDTNQPSGNVETNDGRAPQPKGSDEAGKAGDSA